MPKNRPIFLFAFANDDKDYLAQLKAEERLLRHSLAGIHDQEIIEYQSLSNTDFDDIYDSFYRSRERVAIFHYGGHSNSKGLQLEDRQGKAENLAVLLGKEKGLQLVFLNGCSNEAQVELLWQAGVPAVIATTADINDTRAKTLAHHFYKAIAGGKTIKDAFEIAASTIRDHQTDPTVYRSVGRKSKARKVDIPWGLYAQEEAVLDWSIHSIEVAHRLEALAKLRQASLDRYQEFMGERGRFRHLQIDEAILASIPGVKRERSSLIDHDIKLDQKDHSLAESLPLLWQESCPHAMIIGVGGMGKTVSLLRLWEKWSQAKDPNSPVPIFIQLNEFNNRPEKDFIQNYIRKHFADVAPDELFKKVNKDNKGQRSPHLILLLDGLNEVTARSNELLLEINQLKVQEDYPGLQLIISSRVDLRDTHQWQAFHCLDLQSLSNVQIADYLRGDLPTDARLLELLRNPMMLSLYAAQSELPKRYFEKRLLKEKISSTGELLYNVESIHRIKIEEQYVTATRERIYRRFVLEHLLPYLAWQMQQAGVFSMGEDEMENSPGLLSLLTNACQELINHDFFRVFRDYRKMDKSKFLEKEDWDLLEESIDQVCCTELVLLVNDNEEYRFLHQNFRDYFAARHVQNQIQIALKKKTLPDVLRLAPLDIYVRQLLGELEGEHTNKIAWNPKVKKWQWSEGQFLLNNHLTDLLESCRGIFDQEKLGYTLWNILTIWTEQRDELSGAQLQDLNLQGFYLNGYRAARPGLSMQLSNGSITAEDLFPQGHSASINSTAFSPDGDRILTGSNDQTARVWDAHTGKCLLILQGHSASINSTSYSPDGLRILTGSYDQTAKVWDAHTGECLLTLQGHSDSVSSTAFSPDGDRILTGSDDQTAKVWDAHTGECLLTLQGHSYWVSSTAFSPDGDRILTGSDDQTAKVWDAQTGTCLLTLESRSGLILSTVFSPDGDRILTGSGDQTAKVWDAHTGECLLTLQGHSYWVSSTAFSPDGDRILTGSRDQTAKVWDAHTGECLLTLQGHSYWVSSTAFSPDGDRILTGSLDNTAKVWDAHTGKCLLTLQGHSDSVSSTAFSPDGDRILTGSLDNTAKVWDAHTGKCLLTLQGHLASVSSTAFSPDGDRILTGSRDQTAKVWDAHTGECLLTLQDHSYSIWGMAFSSDGDRILTGSLDNTAKVWDADTGKCLLTLQGHSDAVWSTAFSPDGDRILTGSNDSTAKVWDAYTGECLLTLQGHSDSVSSTAFSPDGDRILTGSSDSTAKVWDAHTGKCMMTLQGHSYWVSSTAFSPDGDRILTGSSDQTAKVWDAYTGKCILTLQGHTSPVRSTVFSPDGSRLLTGSHDRTAKIWDAQTGECRMTLPNIPGLLVQGCDFRGLHPKSGLQEEEVALLRQYGGIFNEEDAREWEQLMEKHFGITP